MNCRAAVIFFLKLQECAGACEDDVVLMCNDQCDVSTLLFVRSFPI